MPPKQGKKKKAPRVIGDAGHGSSKAAAPRGPADRSPRGSIH